jgi:hypothetical protein
MASDSEEGEAAITKCLPFGVSQATGFGEPRMTQWLASDLMREYRGGPFSVQSIPEVFGAITLAAK